MTTVDELELLKELAGVKSMRTADRANVKTMLRKLKRGTELGYQERQNLWAYAMRYGLREAQHPGVHTGS